MSAERDEKAKAACGIIYTPTQMSYILSFEIAKNPNNKSIQKLFSTIEFLEQLPPGTIVRFDPKTLGIQVGSNKSDIRTG